MAPSGHREVLLTFFIPVMGEVSPNRANGGVFPVLCEISYPTVSACAVLLTAHYPYWLPKSAYR